MGEFTDAGLQGTRARMPGPLLVASLGLALPLALVASGARAADAGGAAPAAVGPALLAQAAPDQGNGTTGTSQPQTSGTGATGNALTEVVVTGSRIERSTFTTPNPVTVLNANDIQNLGITNVGQVLGELPQNSNFFAANNVGLGNFNVGAQLANLRGLNPFFGTRTLTLVDTERFVPQATGGGVDVTLIPSMLVARTEVVTGGASAVYGSDAVAGVVNIILDKKLQGFKGQADYGQTYHHDGGDPHVSVAYGTDLGDRAHIIMGAEFENSEDIGICSQVRDWCASNYALFTNNLYNGSTPAPGTPGPVIPPNGLPHYIIGPNATLANQSQTGVLTPCVVAPPVAPVCVHAGPSGFSIPQAPQSPPTTPVNMPMAPAHLGSARVRAPPMSAPMTALRSNRRSSATRDSRIWSSRSQTT